MEGRRSRLGSQPAPRPRKIRLTRQAAKAVLPAPRARPLGPTLPAAPPPPKPPPPPPPETRSARRPLRPRPRPRPAARAAATAGANRPQPRVSARSSAPPWTPRPGRLATPRGPPHRKRGRREAGGQTFWEERGGEKRMGRRTSCAPAARVRRRRRRPPAPPPLQHTMTHGHNDRQGTGTTPVHIHTDLTPPPPPPPEDISGHDPLKHTRPSTPLRPAKRTHARPARRRRRRRAADPKFAHGRGEGRGGRRPPDGRVAAGPAARAAEHDLRPPPGIRGGGRAGGSAARRAGSGRTQGGLLPWLLGIYSRTQGGQRDRLPPSRRGQRKGPVPRGRRGSGGGGGEGGLREWARLRNRAFGGSRRGHPAR